MRSDLDLAYATLGRAVAWGFSEGFASNANMEFKAMFHLKLVKSGRLSQWLLNWVIHINLVVCVANAEEKSKLFVEYSPGLWDGCARWHDLPCRCRWTPVC